MLDWRDPQAIGNEDRYNEWCETYQNQQQLSSEKDSRRNPHFSMNRSLLSHEGLSFANSLEAGGLNKTYEQNF